MTTSPNLDIERSALKSFENQPLIALAEIAHMKDGKVTERWAFSDDTQRIIEFFGSMGGE